MRSPEDLTVVISGVGAAGMIDAGDLRNMAPDPLVFAMANPDPEITPEEADGLAAVMATGRSDYVIPSVFNKTSGSIPDWSRTEVAAE